MEESRDGEERELGNDGDSEERGRAVIARVERLKGKEMSPVSPQRS